MPFPLIPVIAAGASLLNNGINALSTSGANKASMNWQDRMYNIQRRDAIADRNFENNYNSPAAQMARLKAAGLNPNLVYGSGSATQPSAAVRQSTTGSYKAMPAQFDIGTVMTAIFDMLRTKEQTENIKADTENKKAQKPLIEANARLTDYKGSAQWETNNYLTNYLKLRNEGMSFNNMLTEKKIDKIQADIQYTVAQQLRQDLLSGQSIQESLTRIQMMVSNMALNEEKKKEIQQKIENLKSNKKLLDYEAYLNEGYLKGGDPAKIGMGILQNVLQFFRK